MKKVAFVTLSMTKGGAERVIANMCNDLTEEQFSILVEIIGKYIEAINI